MQLELQQIVYQHDHVVQVAEKVADAGGHRLGQDSPIDLGDRLEDRLVHRVIELEHGAIVALELIGIVAQEFVVRRATREQSDGEDDR